MTFYQAFPRFQLAKYGIMAGQVSGRERRDPTPLSRRHRLHHWILCARSFVPVPTSRYSVQVLAERLGKNTTLTSLDLSSNALGSEGGSHIAQVSSSSTGHGARFGSFPSYLFSHVQSPHTALHLVVIVQKLTWMFPVSDWSKVLFSINRCSLQRRREKSE